MRREPLWVEVVGRSWLLAPTGRVLFKVRCVTAKAQARRGKVYNGSNGAFFSANNTITESRTLTAGKRYTIAISWLANGQWAALTAGTNLPRLSQRMTLTVSRAGQPTRTSEILANNYQLLDFTVPAGGGGAYTITINRVYNSGVGGVALALTVGEHD